VQDLQEQCSLQIKARLLSRKVWDLVMLLPTNPDILERLSTIVEQVFLFICLPSSLLSAFSSTFNH